MASLHFPTVNLFMVMLLLAATMVFALVAFHYRHRNAVLWWLLGCVLIGAGYLLRWWPAQDQLAQLFWPTGGLFIAGNLAIWTGLYRFCGLRRATRPGRVSLLLALLWLCALAASYTVQIALTFLIAGWLNLLSFLAIRRAHHLGSQAMRLAVAWIFLATAIVMLIRVLVFYGYWQWQWPLSVEQVSVLGQLPAAVMLILRCFALLLLLHIRQQYDLEQLAITDPLTGVLNRKGFLEHGQRLLDRQQPGDLPMAVLMMDLDHFKQINDRHGHAAGDAVLRHFARLLRAQLRPSDCTGRLGGEEFAALLPGVSEATAMRIAERLRAQLQQQAIASDAGVLHASVSIGVQLSTQPALPLETLLQAADRALYQAKENGRNQVVAAPAIEATSAEEKATVAIRS